MRVEEVRLTPQGHTVPFSEWMGAFLHASEDNNATFQALQAHFEARDTLSPVRRVSFSSERKWSAVQFPDFTFVVGAPERLAGQGELPGLGTDFSAGKRVLLAGITHEAPEPGRTPAGVQVLAAIVLSDPIRPDAAETLAYFRREGVSLKLISGDNPATAAALAAQAGFPEADRFIDMSRVTDENAIAATAETYCVFGRVSPQQKRQLVQALRRQGHCVAMTGDGVNDLLALQEADCSIAVASGSDAARQVSQVVLLDSDFAALPEVLSQGRRVVNNITRVAGIFFVKTLYSILLCFVCVLLNIPFPFAPIQITLIDLIIEGYPSFFLSFDPDGRKISGRFLPSVLRRALPNALAILFCFLLWLALDRVLPLPAQQRNTLFYLLVGTVGIQAVFKACWPPNRLRVFLCVTMTAAFYTAVLLLHTVLQTALPTGTVWALLAAFALLSVLLERGGTALLRLIRPPRAERGQSSPAPQPH